MATTPLPRVALRRAVAWLGVYVVLVIGLTWPLARRATTALPDPNFAAAFDPYQSTWAMAWTAHAVTTNPSRFAQANIYHPTPDALFYGQIGLGAAPLFAPVFLATGNPILAANVTLLLGLALTAWGLHLVVERWGGSTGGGMVAGATLLTNHWAVWNFVPTAPHWAALFYLPWIVLGTASARSVRSLLPLYALTALQCSVDVVYASPAVLAPMSAIAAGRLLRPERRGDGARLLAVIAAVVAALAPMTLGYARVRASHPDLLAQTNWGMAESMPVFGLGEYLFGTGRAAVVTPVVGALVVAAVIATRWPRRASRADGIPRRAWVHAAVWATIGLALAIPSRVEVMGEQVRTPVALVAAVLPPFHALRDPNRLSVAGLIGLSLLAGLATASLLARFSARTWARAAIASMVVGALYVDYRYPREPIVLRPGEIVRPRVLPAYPLRTAPTVPDVLLPALRAGDEPLVELPLGNPVWAPAPHARAMMHSITHWRPILNGYASFWPHGFVDRLALVTRLPDPAAIDELLRETGLRLVWVHVNELGPLQRARWARARTDESRLEVVSDTGSDLLLRIRTTP